MILNETLLFCIVFTITMKMQQGGKTGERHFLYQIVENTDNCIDVNKFDYLARDSYYVGVGHSFNFKRIISYMQVFETRKGVKEICFRDKVR